jgi:hypothetical protein
MSSVDDAFLAAESLAPSREAAAYLPHLGNHSTHGGLSAIGQRPGGNKTPLGRVRGWPGESDSLGGSARLDASAFRIARLNLSFFPRRRLNTRPQPTGTRRKAVSLRNALSLK